MKKYLKDLETELRKNNLSEEEIKEILADHAEMIEAAKNEGLSDEDLVKKFGDPDKLAEELSDFSEKSDKSQIQEPNTDGFHNYEFKNIPEGYDAEIILINEDLEIKVVDEEVVYIDVVGKYKPEHYEINFKDNLLTLKRLNKRSNSYFGIRRNVKFILSLPKSKIVGDFKLKLINGDVSFNEFKSASISIKTTNGDLEINDLETNEFKINTVNGDTSIKKLQCEDFDATAVNGDFKIDEMKVSEEFYINTVSGDVDLTNSECDSAILKTVSGDLDGKEFYPNTISLKSVSGDIKIVNTDLLRPIEVQNKKTVSGDIDIITKQKTIS